MSNSTPPPPPPATPGSPYGPPAPQPAYSAPGGSDKYNVLSIVSLVTAFFVSLAAVITGHIALGQIKRTGEKGRGLAIAGLIIGYLGLLAGIITIIVLIAVLPAALRAADANNPGFDTGSGPLSTSEPAPTSTPSAGASGGQSTAESCEILLSSVSDSAAALQENFSQLQSDPAAAVVALQKLSSDFDEGLSQISDPDVYAAGDKANSSLKTMISDIQALEADPSAGSGAIIADAQDVQDDFNAIDTVCP